MDLTLHSWPQKPEMLLFTLHSLTNLEELSLNVAKIGQDRKEIACIQNYVLSSSSLLRVFLNIHFLTKELHSFLDELPVSIQSFHLAVDILEDEIVSLAWWEKHFKLKRSNIKLSVSLFGDLKMNFDLRIPAISQNYFVEDDCMISKISSETLEFEMSGRQNHCLEFENSNLKKIQILAITLLFSCSFPSSLTDLTLEFDDIKNNYLDSINLKNCRNLKTLSLGNCLKVELTPNLQLEELRIVWDKENDIKNLLPFFTKQVNLDFEKLAQGPEYVRQYLQCTLKKKSQPEQYRFHVSYPDFKNAYNFIIEIRKISMDLNSLQGMELWIYSDKMTVPSEEEWKKIEFELEEWRKFIPYAFFDVHLKLKS